MAACSSLAGGGSRAPGLCFLTFCACLPFSRAARITHFGGVGGSRIQPYRAIIEWHRSYWLYYRKNLASDYFFLFNWFYYSLMLLKLIFSLLINSLRREKQIGRAHV